LARKRAGKMGWGIGDSHCEKAWFGGEESMSWKTILFAWNSGYIARTEGSVPAATAANPRIFNIVFPPAFGGGGGGILAPGGGGGGGAADIKT